MRTADLANLANCGPHCSQHIIFDFRKRLLRFLTKVIEAWDVPHAAALPGKGWLGGIHADEGWRKVCRRCKAAAARSPASVCIEGYELWVKGLSRCCTAETVLNTPRTGDGTRRAFSHLTGHLPATHSATASRCKCQMIVRCSSHYNPLPAKFRQVRATWDRKTSTAPNAQALLLLNPL